jgi:hypothetical protein
VTSVRAALRPPFIVAIIAAMFATAACGPAPSEALPASVATSPDTGDSSSVSSAPSKVRPLPIGPEEQNDVPKNTHNVVMTHLDEVRACYGRLLDEKRTRRGHSPSAGA